MASDSHGAKNELETLKRFPSDLRRYMAWSRDIKARYGSITSFVINERLHWRPEESASPSTPPTFAHQSDVPFAERSDYAVLINDWPYGFTDNITHICVWSKVPIAVDDQRGDVTPESRRLIEEFVDEYFVQPLADGRNRVMWFKNWVSLQSVRGVDHIHVLVDDVPKQQLDKWTVRKDL